MPHNIIPFSNLGKNDPGRTGREAANLETVVKGDFPVTGGRIQYGREEETLWTRAYGDEYWADVTSPLFFSTLGEYLTKYVLQQGYKVFGYWELQDKELLKLHKGHIYFNSEVLEAVFTFNPKFSRTKELLNYFPEQDQARIANAKTKLLRRIWAEIRTAFLDPDGMITRTDKAYRKWADFYIRDVQRFDSLDLTTSLDGDLEREYERMVEGFRRHYQLIRYGLVTHSIGSNLILKGWLTDWLDDKSGTIYSKLLSGLHDNKTVITNIEVERLAKAAKEDSRVKNLLTTRSSNEFLTELETNPDLKDYSIKLHDFIKNYGHRSHTRELFFPRWADDPTLIIDVLKALGSAGELDLEELEKRKVEERIDIEKMVLKRISKLGWGFLRKPIFKVVLKYAQSYTVFRENQRFYLDHTLYRMRRLFIEYGHRLTERRIIEKVDDIFFLSKEEIFELIKTTQPNVKETIAQRRREFEEYVDKLPPKFLKGKIEFDDSVVRETNVLKIVGTSASAGIATGPIRIVESIKQLSEVKEGEILVTSNTDPGWTPVFSKLIGLITETGGILSHGAVVSREYGIPAVTAVKDAKSIFRTGQKVTINGDEGVILLLEG